MIQGGTQLQAGWEHQANGRWDQAERLYREVLDAWPDHPEAWCLLGTLDLMRGRFAEAAASFDRAIQIRPDFAQAHNNLGIARSEAGQAAEAEASYREAIRLAPGDAEAYNNLGSTLRDLLRLDEAVAAFRQAVALRADYAEAWNNLGVALTDAGNLREAAASLRHAVGLRPHYAEAWQNLGNALRDAGDDVAAADAFDRSLAIRPDYPEARYNRALLLLQRGDEAAGWAEFECRWQCREFPHRPLPSPLWDGSPLEGRTVLLIAEQGLGDTIQFVRFARLVRDRGGRAVLVCPPRLAKLIARSDLVDEVVMPGAALPTHDVHLHLMSLPRIVGLLDADDPVLPPYLRVDPERAGWWGQRLDPHPGRRIGVAWQGNPRFRGDRRRSFPLAALEPLARLADVTLISLQKGEGKEQLDAIGDHWPIVDLGPEYHEGDLDDTAAVVANLDLVIASDSVVAHLAGALARPVWVAHGAYQEWRWTPEAVGRWYPSAEVFRQPEPGRWDRVVAAMIERLQAMPPAPIRIEISPGELIDRLTILELKWEQIAHPESRAAVRREYEALRVLHERFHADSAELDRWVADLRAVNRRIWEVEDAVRRCEAAGDFGPAFVEAARTVYRENDRRAALKRAINDHLGSPLQEVKSHSLSGADRSTGDT